MNKYLIKASVTTGIEIEVEANSEAEALKKADRISINDWDSVEDEGFEIRAVEEVEDETI
jgi:hypothetical protein